MGNVGIAGLFLLEKGQSPAELRAIVHAVAAEVHRVSNETVRLVGCATDGEHNSLGLADEGQAPRSIADIHASNLPAYCLGQASAPRAHCVQESFRACRIDPQLFQIEVILLRYLTT